MTVTTPTPDDEGAKEALREAEEIIKSESEQINVEVIFQLACRVGVMLNGWRKLMIEGGFTEEWVQDTSMTLFYKFFSPWYPPFGEDHDHDGS